MTDPFYRGRYAELGVEVVTPGREAVREVDRIIFEELCRGRASPDSRAYYRRVVEGLGRAGAEGVILGCTEITLLLGEGELGDIPVLDTTALHTTRAVELALEGVGLTVEDKLAMSPHRTTPTGGPPRHPAFTRRFAIQAGAVGLLGLGLRPPGGPPGGRAPARRPGRHRPGRSSSSSSPAAWHSRNFADSTGLQVWGF